MRTLKELEAAFMSKGLPNYFNAFKPLVKNAIRIALDVQDDDNIGIGASKFGGCPDLPRDVEWFRKSETNIPMSFVCQINFAEAKPYDVDDKLPASGMLYLFYDCSDEGMPWGFDPEDASGKKVFFYEGNIADLQRKAAPDDLEENGCLFGSAQLTFERCLELPDWESDQSESIAIPEDEQERYWELLDEIADNPINKLLGHSNNIQGSMELECELVSRGLYCGDASGYTAGRLNGFDQNTQHWNLLLQVDSNEELDMMWGDCGRLYLWMTDEDLIARTFENAWLILQCY